MAPQPESFPVRDAVVEVYDQAPGTNDASDMYVLYFKGVSVLVRERLVDKDEPEAGIELFVHVENEDRDPTCLVIDVNDAGETDYQI